MREIIAIPELRISFVLEAHRWSPVGPTLTLGFRAVRCGRRELLATPMALTLNGADLRSLSEATQIFVSPLAYPSAEEWRAAIHGATRSLFRADQTMTIMAGAGELVLSEDVDSSVLRSLRTWFDPVTPEGHLVMSDPVVNEWNDRRRRLGLRVFTRDVINEVIEDRVLESPYVNEALIPNRIQYWEGGYGHGVGGSEAIFWISYDRPETRKFGDGTVDVLSLLTPAYQAGLDALARVRTARAALDELADPLLVFDLSGREIHRSAALASVLAEEATAPVLARAKALARDFAATFSSSGRPTDLTAPVARLSAGGREYRLRLTLLPAGLLAEDVTIAVLVLQPTASVLPDRESLQAVHRLTPREAEVALRLARGASRKGIARDLGVSPHTVRAQTEKVFLKLGVSTRSAVAAALLGGFQQASR